MKKVLKKAVLSFLALLILFASNFSLFASTVRAQVRDQDSTWYNQPFTEWYAKVYDEDTSPPNEIFGERYTAAQVQWIIWGLISQPLNWIGRDNQKFIACAIKWAGNDTINVAECWLGYAGYIRKVIEVISPFTIGQGTQNDSPLALISQNSVGVKYIGDKLSRFGIIPKANAQEGFGYGAVGIMQPLWGVSRNLAYTFLVLFVIIFAFMIMFRVKISPQLVISVQSALPKIIVAAVLATFSFAIAGLVIDLMYVVIGVIAGFLNPLDFTPGFRIIYNFIAGISPTGIGVTTSSPIAVFAYMFVYTILFLMLVVVNLVSVFATLSLFSALLSILTLLLVVWLAILCIWYMIKIPWVLIKTLINIFLSVVVAPIQIVAGAIMPQIGFAAWIKNLIANVLVFPLVGLMFYFAYFFLSYAYITVVETGLEREVMVEISRALGFSFPLLTEGVLPGNLWSPPFLGSGAEITPLIFALMSFGIIIAIPKAADILKAALLGAKFDYGMAIGEAMGPVKWGYKASGAQLASEMLSAQGSAAMLWKLAGTEQAPFYKLMTKLNKKWPTAMQNIQEKAGMAADTN